MTAVRDDAAERVAHVFGGAFREQLGFEPPSHDTTLETLFQEVDSLEVLSLIGIVEEGLGVDLFAAVDPSSLVTVGDVLEALAVAARSSER